MTANPQDPVRSEFTYNRTLIRTPPQADLQHSSEVATPLTDKRSHSWLNMTPLKQHSHLILQVFH